MAFTAAELTSIANAALSFYIDRGKMHDQAIQDKPLLAVLENKKKSFPGGDGTLSVGVKGVYGAGGVNDQFAGYTHDDAVNFYTPSNMLRAEYDWREHHIGFTMTHTELKMDGLSVEDTNGASTTAHSQRELTVLKGLLDNKLEDFGEQRNRSMNALLWGDGTTDPKALAGVRSIIVDDPTTGTVGGISAATNTWWRNRARTAAHGTAGGTGAVTSSPANGGALWEVLQHEWRQLRRWGGNPDIRLAGSDFIQALEREMKANGNYSDKGFAGGGEGGIGDVTFKGKAFVYDPTLDDLGLSKRAYMWDSRDIALYAMENEWNRQHTPARPHNKFVLYRSLTATGQLVCRRRRTALVIDIA